MKYIRTKDGIFTFEGANTITKIYDLSSQGIPPLKYADGTLEKEGDKYVTINHKDYKVTDKNIADTIDELCDVFVLVDKTNSKHKYYSKEDSWHFFEVRDFAECEVLALYGAIWTDKGLIYVAEMNDKGELELL